MKKINAFSALAISFVATLLFIVGSCTLTENSITPVGRAKKHNAARLAGGVNFWFEEAAPIVHYLNSNNNNRYQVTAWVHNGDTPTGTVRFNVTHPYPCFKVRSIDEVYNGSTSSVSATNNVAFTWHPYTENSNPRRLAAFDDGYVKFTVEWLSGCSYHDGFVFLNMTAPEQTTGEFAPYLDETAVQLVNGYP